MSKTLFFILFFHLLTISSVFSQATQSQRLDSMHQLLRKEPVDTAKVEILLDIAFAHRNSAPDSTLYYSNRALIISREIKYPDGEAQAIRNVGLSYSKMGNYDTAIQISKSAITFAKQNNVINPLADAYNTLGINYFYKGDYDSAVNAFKKTLEIYEQQKRQVDLAGSLVNIGSILDVKGEYTRALDYFQKALLQFEELNHTEGIATVSYNMANIFSEQGDTEKALKYQQMSAHYDSLNNNVVGFAGTLNHIGDSKLTLGDTVAAKQFFYNSIATYLRANAKCRTSEVLTDLGGLYLNLGQMDSAFYYLNEAVDVAEACDHINDLIGAAAGLGEYYLVINNYDRAITYFRQSYDLAKKDELKPSIATAAEYLYQAYKKKNDIANALYYLEINKQLEDELFSERNTRELAQLEATYNLEKEKQYFEHEKQINKVRYEEQLAREKYIQQIIVVALFIVCGLLVFSVWLYMQKRNVNARLDTINTELTQQHWQIKEQNEEIRQQHDQLQHANNELEALNEEKNAIIGIVAHDLKSPLNQIKGLIELIGIDASKGKDNVEDYMGKIQQASNRSLEMVERILDINVIENKTIAVKEETHDLKVVLDDLRARFLAQTKSKHIDVNLQLAEESFSLNTDRLLLDEILENILSNAIKFSPQGGDITIGLERDDKLAVISISDQGPGISKEDQKMMYNKYQRASANPTADEKSTGLGLAIVKRYVDALGYSIECVSTPGSGTTFNIRIPFK